MSDLRFYGGVDEIGGNKILVKENNASVFLDFGMSFSTANRYFSEFLQPRKANGILDFMEVGLLPQIKGIYREDYLKHCGLECEEDAPVDGVLLSHAHMDHSSYIHHLREYIPIYVTEHSYLILKVLEDTSRVSFIVLLNLKKDYHFRPKKRVEGYKRLKGDQAKMKRDVRKIKPYKKFEIGNYKIKSLPLDHSLPGATGYIVESDDETIVYTGDMRFHGRKPDLSRRFVTEARKANPTIMISEGTRIGEIINNTEQDVEGLAQSVINNFEGFVMCNFPIRDLDRLQTFYNVAIDTDRELVVNLKQAYLLQQFQGQDYPDVDEVAVYISRKGWGLLGDDHYAYLEGEGWICTSKMESNYMKTDYDK